MKKELEEKMKALIDQGKEDEAYDLYRDEMKKETNSLLNEDVCESCSG
ncbi:MAG: hypothetical protein WDN67_00525 [Candidatus Moraniibacteriota bacterium]